MPPETPPGRATGTIFSSGSKFETSRGDIRREMLAPGKGTG